MIKQYFESFGALTDAIYAQMGENSHMVFRDNILGDDWNFEIKSRTYIRELGYSIQAEVLTNARTGRQIKIKDCFILDNYIHIVPFDYAEGETIPFKVLYVVRADLSEITGGENKSMTKKPINVFEPRKGDSVSLYYDGKMGRRVDGVVTRRMGFCAEIEFVPRLSETGEKVKIIVKRNSPESFGGFLRGDGEMGIMRALGCSGDYYRASK